MFASYMYDCCALCLYIQNKFLLLYPLKPRVLQVFNSISFVYKLFKSIYVMVDLLVCNTCYLNMPLNFPNCGVVSVSLPHINLNMSMILVGIPSWSMYRINEFFFYR